MAEPNANCTVRLVDDLVIARTSRTRSGSFEFPQAPTSRVAELTEDGARKEFMLFPLDIVKSRFSRLRKGRRADVRLIVHEQNANVGHSTSPDTF